MKSKIYAFDPAIYPFPVLVSKKFDIDELKDVFYVALNRDEVAAATTEFNRAPTSTARVVTVVRKDTNRVYFLVLLFRPKDVGVGIMAHEATHVCTDLCYWLGFGEPTPNTDEPHAYFVGWVANCVESVLRNNPAKMKGVEFEI